VKAGADMGEIRDNVKRNLGYYLSLRGMSQKELAGKLSVSQSAVTNWIKGKNSPDIEIVARICDILDISIVELFGTNGSEQYSEQEKKVITQYRKKPELQPAIHILLGITKPNRDIT
jgi:transcriptional regulator with XRE-family HTH domain